MAWWKWLLAGAGVGILIFRRWIGRGVFRSGILMTGKVWIMIQKIIQNFEGIYWYLASQK